MDKWRGIKCEPGYIDRQKVFQGAMLILFTAIGFALFLVGFIVTKTRANVFTVLGILMVLPAAKRVIALVVMLPRHSVRPERVERMRATLGGEAVLLTDYVFTSPDKIMSLDFVVIHGQRVIGVGPVNDNGSGERREKNRDYMKDYLQKGVAGIAPDYRVELLASDEEFYERYAELSGADKASGDPDEAQRQEEEVVKYLKILAV